ncbi:hypothetical protein H0H92_002966 [Tricholoma furcatifolium]|nr:hypothetical protein H0H92_002966 [Tricholoma furcatifolium]
MGRKAGHKEPVTPGPRQLRPRQTEDPPQPAPKPRRTSEQVKKDLSAKEKQKQDKLEARKSMIEDVAHLESSLVEQEARLLSEAHRPPAPPSARKKVSRPRPIIQDSTEGPEDDTSGRNTETTDSVIDPALLQHQLNPAPAEDREMILANSDDDEDSSPQQEPRNGMQEKVSVRELVNASRHVNSDSGHKRKASASSTSDHPLNSSHKKTKKRNGGFRDNWKDTTPTSSSQTQSNAEQISRSVSANSSLSNEPPRDTSRAAARAQDSDDELVGGLSDEASGEQAERARMVDDSKPALTVGSKVKSLAVVVETTSVPDFVPGISTKIINNRHLGTKGLTKKKNIRLSDLNERVQRKWDSAFKPRVIEYLGTLTPWDEFTQDDKEAVQDIWAYCYPNEARMESDRDVAILSDIVSSWQHKFSSTAKEFLTSVIFESPDLQTTEARQAWVEWALARDVSEEDLLHAPEHSRRFYYREYEEPEEPGGNALKSKGIFQSPIIIATLASHFQWIDRIEVEDRGEEFPVGALVLSVQAFSASNWADREDRDGPSGMKKSNLTSDIVAAVQELTKKQQARIKSAVTEYLRHQNRSVSRKRLSSKPAAPAPATAIASRPKVKLRDEDSDDCTDSADSGET